MFVSKNKNKIFQKNEINHIADKNILFSHYPTTKISFS